MYREQIGYNSQISEFKVYLPHVACLDAMFVFSERYICTDYTTLI